MKNFNLLTRMATLPIGYYDVYLTPKAYDKILKEFPEIIELVMFKFYPTHYVYMNMMDRDWTEDDCDAVIYFVKKEENGTTERSIK